MSKSESNSSSSALDPISRTSEILFGLIMVLSFTCTLSVASAGREDVREMLIGALGCNLAWGIIDAFFYLMNVAGERGRERVLVRKIKDSNDPNVARDLLHDYVPEILHGSLTPQSINEVRDNIVSKYSDPKGALITFADLRAAFIVFALVFLSTFPVAAPFLVMNEPMPALRVSNAIALILLYALGASLGRYAGRRPMIWGFGMVIVGTLLVSITIALGG